MSKEWTMANLDANTKSFTKLDSFGDQLRSIGRPNQEEKKLAQEIVGEMPTVIKNRITDNSKKLEEFLIGALARWEARDRDKLEMTSSEFRVNVYGKKEINMWENIYHFPDMLKTYEEHIRSSAGYNSSVLEIVYGKLFGSNTPTEYEKCNVTIEGKSIRDYWYSTIRDLAKRMNVDRLEFYKSSDGYCCTWAVHF
jgi:hypothetical protein